MPSGGALAITARMSTLLMSVAVRGGKDGCDDVTACQATSRAARTAGGAFLMRSPCGRLLYADDSAALRRLDPRSTPPDGCRGQRSDGRDHPRAVQMTVDTIR